MTKTHVNDLGADPIGPLLLRLALPAMTAQVVNALYNMVDRMYIGHMPVEGNLALTGLGVTFAVLMLVGALSALVGVGGGARASIHMGEGNAHRAEELLGGSAALLLLLSAAVIAVMQVCKRPMLLLFGASPDTIGYAVDYLRIYLWGTPFVLLAVGLNNFISIQGFSRTAMTTVLVGAGLNIVLDPIFIFALDMGVEGAALATVLSQAVSAAWVVWFLSGKKTKLRLRRSLLRVRGAVMLPALAIGASPFVMQATESLLNITFTASLQRYGGDPAVGALTIAGSVMQVGSMVMSGLAQGAQPIIGYNYGAGRSQRVRGCFRLLLTCSVVMSTLLWLGVELIPGPFVALFNDDPELVEYARWAIRIYLAGFFALGVQFACQQTFVALGQAKISMLLAMLRKLILLIPLILILPHLLADPVFAVFVAEPVADLLAATVTGCLFFTRFSGILARREQELSAAKAR